MDEPIYILKKKIEKLLKEKDLKIQILNGQNSEVKKTQSMKDVFNYLCDNSKASLEILEIDFWYYHEFSPLDFEKGLIEKLKSYKND
tara:strand:- start:389 stop:649 length:261 start_codon:yes stop_codon:yes gene_type:complete